MEKSPYNFEMIRESEGGKVFRIMYQGREVGTIETTEEGEKKVSLLNGQRWEGFLSGDMWDFLLSEEPFNEQTNIKSK